MRRKRKRGDRKDGIWLKKLEPYHALMPYIMKTKNSSNNAFADSIEITQIDRFLRKKRITGFTGIGMLHIFIAAYVRAVSQYPAVNRFVVGQRIYARNNIEVIMSVKRKLSVTAGETSIKVEFGPGSTIFDVYEKINAEISKVKGDQETNTDSAAKAMMRMPRLILKLAVSVLTALDYFGKLPKSLIAASPFHGSMVITDLGSIGIPPVFHHLYNFGTLPVFIAFGAKRKAFELNKDGQPEIRKYVDFTLMLDERICDGFYFAQAYRTLVKYLRNPELLETPPDNIVIDKG